MNYYKHHIGDFDKATRHLSRIERSIYRDLIELYYDTEKQLTLDRAALCRKIIANSNEEAAAVEQTLNEFFTETPTGWYHVRCEAEIEQYHNSTSQKAQAGKASALKRAANKQQSLNGSAAAVEQTLNGNSASVERSLIGRATNQEPLTINQEPVVTAMSSGKPDDRMPCPVEKIVDLYHQHMPLNPKCKILNESRRAAIRQRWKEAAAASCEPFGYASVADGLAAWSEFFSVCSESEFLTGRAQPRPGNVPFLADIDFLFSPKGFAKCLENKYHREAA